MRFRTEDIMPPPIVKLAEAAKRFISSPDFLDLGQGLPGHIPPEDAIASLRERLILRMNSSLHQVQTTHLLGPS